MTSFQVVFFENSELIRSLLSSPSSKILADAFKSNISDSNTWPYLFTKTVEIVDETHVGGDVFKMTNFLNIHVKIRALVANIIEL